MRGSAITPSAIKMRSKHFTSFLDEHDFQNYLVDRLRGLGYTVEVMSSNSRGKKQHKGITDLFVRKEGWNKGMWLHAECKGEKTKLSIEQEESFWKGNIVVWRTWNEVADTLNIPIEAGE